MSSSLSSQLAALCRHPSTHISPVPFELLNEPVGILLNELGVVLVVVMAGFHHGVKICLEALGIGIKPASELVAYGGKIHRILDLGVVARGVVLYFVYGFAERTDKVGSTLKPEAKIFAH